MKNNTLAMWLVVFCFLLLTRVIPASAMSDADKAVWGASEKVDTTFIVSSAHGVAVMGKAQGLISQWNTIDRDMTVMKIQTVTDNLIETYNPTDIGNLGFNVTRTTLPAGDQISISTMYYTGNIFSIGTDKKNAGKRAHLLSYFLQMYDKKLAETTAPAATASDSAVSTSNNPNFPDESEDYLKIIHYQLSVGKYELALKYLEDLKNAILDKEKAISSSKTPVTPPPIATPVAPVTPAAPATDPIKPSPSP